MVLVAANALFYQFGTATSAALVAVRLVAGLLSSIIVFIPTTLLGFVFRRIGERDARTALGEKALALHFVDTQLMRPHGAVERVLLDWRLPWWTEPLLYLLVAFGWLLCFYVSILYGVTFTETQANAWLLSFGISVLSSVLLLQTGKALLAGLVAALGGDRGADAIDEASLPPVPTPSDRDSAPRTSHDSARSGESSGTGAGGPPGAVPDHPPPRAAAAAAAAAGAAAGQSQAGGRPLPSSSSFTSEAHGGVYGDGDFGAGVFARPGRGLIVLG
jgi:hypothetical protein